MIKNLGIYCAGSLGKELYDIAGRINECGKKWKSVVFLDDTYVGKCYYGARVYRPDSFCGREDDIEIVIANGTPEARKKIREKIQALGLRLANLIDPTAIISPTSTLGQGIVVTPYSTISSDVVLRDNVLVQSYVRVGHDIDIQEDCVISANVGIGGCTVVGSQTYIGMGAVIKEDLHIGNNVIVSMGAVVHTNVEDGVTVVGLPGRIARKNVDGKVFG